ncbi:MAG TPA: tagaturonate epimerase family protein, partial [Victivallales bacterium]|nr:tagaturonate epimerase family protein [Victivallales bacterium]
HEDAGFFALKCPLSNENAIKIRQLFAWTSPVSLKKKKTTMGFGDRLGRATLGHISAIKKFEISPVLAQQSMRELSLTGRTYTDVLDDVTFMVFQSDFREDFGADGDHLKNIEDIDSALNAGFTMITLDLSDAMKPKYSLCSDSEVENEFEKLPFEVKERIKETYFNRNVITTSFNFNISKIKAKRNALIYYDAIELACRHAKYIRKRKNENVDIEISIDETTTPTDIEDHFFIVNELIAKNIDFVSIAPRFVGEFQKAIDYIGNTKKFKEDFHKHAELARHYGTYKISIHSGSDKFSVFPIIGELTKNKFHLKTAGTSWLEALKVIAIENPSLYRVIHKKAINSFDEAKKFYHVTTDILKITDIDSLPDQSLPDYLNFNESRQLLHITYGAILNDKNIRSDFFQTLDENEKLYIQKLDEHFTKHLSELGIKRREL